MTSCFVRDNVDIYHAAGNLRNKSVAFMNKIKIEFLKVIRKTLS